MAEMQDFEKHEVSEFDAVEEKQQQESQAAETQEVKDTQQAGADEGIPDEFKGYSLKELANIAKHARQQMGRQANELGEVRKLADELIKSQLKPKEQVEPPKEVDFFENPQEAIRRAVESNPRVLQAEQYALMAQREQAKQRLSQLHPDFAQVVQDGEFAQWITSSKVRTKLFKEAEAYDVDAADELLSTFKTLKSLKKQESQNVVSDAEKKARSQAMSAAAVDTSGSGETSKKVYKRTDLIRLKMNDPNRYDEMADEILAAYREGRVR